MTETKLIKLVDGRRVSQKRFIRMLKERIMSEPKCYNQRAMIELNNPRAQPSCNTPACIGGWMEFLLFGNEGEKLVDKYNEKNPFSHAGGTYEFAHLKVFGNVKWPWLFDSRFHGGPEGLADLFLNAKTAEEKAYLACFAISCYCRELGVKQ